MKNCDALSGQGLLPRRSWLSRVRVHVVRFFGLVAGLFAFSEVLFAAYACLEHVEYLKTLSDLSSCAVIALLGLVIVGPIYLAIHLTPVVILALGGTIFWAWWERRRS